MAKAPAFQFYASDFLTDTQSWEAIEVGIYIRLLSNQWVNGSLPNDLKRLSRIAGCDFEDMKKAWVILGFKFSVYNSIELMNDKLEYYREEQQRFKEKQHQNGIKGGRPLKTETQTKPKNNPTVNPNDKPSKSQTKPLHTSSSNKEIIKKDFDLFWDLYPKKVAKEDCFKMFQKLPQNDIDKILNTVEDFANHKPFETYSHPHPKTYLNQRRWDDVIEVKPKEYVSLGYKPEIPN